MLEPVPASEPSINPPSTGIHVPLPSAVVCLPKTKRPAQQHAPNPLHHLPTELLYNILTGLPDGQLLGLSKLCKGLNKLCLDLFLKRINVIRNNSTNRRALAGSINILTSSQNIYSTFFILQCLCSWVTAFSQPITSLSIQTDRGQTSYLHPTLKLLERLVQSRPSIGTLSLELAYANADLTDGKVELALAALLDQAGRKGCTKLSLRGGPVPNKLLITRQPFNDNIIHPITTAKTLELRSPITLGLQFRRWLLDTLNSSPITRLVIIVSLRGPLAQHILPQIYIPTLTHLDLDSPGTVLAQLIPFFRQHPSLTNLDLRQMIAKLSIPDDSVEGILPNLLTINAPAEVLNVLLRLGTSCAQVKTVNVVDGSFDWGQCRNTPLTWPFIRDSENSSVRHPFALICRSRRTPIALGLKVAPINIRLYSLYDSTNPHSLEPTLRALSCVTELHLTHRHDAKTALVPDWIKLFEKTETVHLIGKTMATDISRKDKVEAVQELMISCPKLKRVSFGLPLLVKTVEEWLGVDEQRGGCIHDDAALALEE